MSDRHIMREDISNSVARIPAGVPALTPIDSHSHQHSPFTYKLKLFIVSSLPNKNSLGCEPNHPSAGMTNWRYPISYLLRVLHASTSKGPQSFAAALSKSPQSLIVAIECWSALCPSLQETFCCIRTPSYQCLKATFPNSQIISKRCEHSTSSTHFNPRFTFKILERFSCELCECVNEIRPLRHFLPPPPGHS